MAGVDGVPAPNHGRRSHHRHRRLFSANCQALRKACEGCNNNAAPPLRVGVY